MSSIKGKPIRFIHGTYNRKTGWFDTAKVHTSCCFYVIIDMGKGRDYATRVSKNSVSVKGATSINFYLLVRSPLSGRSLNIYPRGLSNDWLDMKISMINIY